MFVALDLVTDNLAFAGFLALDLAFAVLAIFAFAVLAILSLAVLDIFDVDFPVLPVCPVFDVDIPVFLFPVAVLLLGKFFVVGFFASAFASLLLGKSFAIGSFTAFASASLLLGKLLVHQLGFDSVSDDLFVIGSHVVQVQVVVLGHLLDSFLGLIDVDIIKIDSFFLGLLLHLLHDFIGLFIGVLVIRAPQPVFLFFLFFLGLFDVGVLLPVFVVSLLVLLGFFLLVTVLVFGVLVTVLVTVLAFGILVTALGFADLVTVLAFGILVTALGFADLFTILAISLVTSDLAFIVTNEFEIESSWELEIVLDVHGNVLRQVVILAKADGCGETEECECCE